MSIASTVLASHRRPYRPRTTESRPSRGRVSTASQGRGGTSGYDQQPGLWAMSNSQESIFKENNKVYQVPALPISARMMQPPTATTT
jgi:hypothetical protein